MKAPTPNRITRRGAGDWYLVDDHRWPWMLGRSTAWALAGDDATVLDQFATSHTPRFGALDRTGQAIFSELALAADRLRASGVHMVLREEQVGEGAVTVRAARPCDAHCHWLDELIEGGLDLS